MNKALVIYSSKTGFTRKYATWICDALDADLLEFNDRERVNYSHYDTVIFGGGFYAGKINNIKWFKKQLPEFKDKKLVLFVTGAMSHKAPGIMENIKKNFKDDEWGRFKSFYMQGGLDYEHMHEMDRAMMTVFRYILKLTNKDKRIVDQISQSFDAASKDQIVRLVEYCKK